MRFSWTQGRGMMAVSAAIIALHGAQAALAQFVPYVGNQNQAYAQYQAPQQGMQQVPQYQVPQYTAMAFQGTNNIPQAVESIAPGAVQGQAMQAAPVQSIPSQSYSAAPAAGCNCQPAPAVNYTQAAPAQMGYGYPAVSGCGNSYNTYEGGGCGIGASSYGGCGDGGYGNGLRTGVFSGVGLRNSGRQWFGGFYGLYMERDGNPWKGLAFSTLDTNGPGYYPADNEVALNLTDIDNDTFAGAEFRFGSTFGGSCGCAPRFAWEFAYWGLLEESQTAAVSDTTGDGNRLYGMIDYRGLEYDGGTGYRPVNHYYDYGPPTSDYTVGATLDEIQVRSITARNTFSVQNIELNLLRLPVCSGGYYAAASGAGYGAGRRPGRLGLGRRGRGACGVGGCDMGCDSGGCGLGGGCCDTGCGSCATGCGGPRYSITGLVGFRYLRMDEDFMYRTDFENVTTPGTGFLAHNIDVDSHLVGAQFGCNAIYHCGCSGRWALHCNTSVGVYNNHTEVWNRMDSPTGDLRYANGTTADFDVRYEADDIAFVGELRAGASYQYSCNWRLFGGYRLFGVSGAALAFDQITPQFISPAQTSYVDSDGSIFMHGLQTGIECTY